MLDIILFKDNVLLLLDQRKIPGEVSQVSIENSDEAADAITNMTVRGAPAIGIAAAYGYCLGCIEAADMERSLLPGHMREVKSKLQAARPTAVNLRWALDRMEEKYVSLEEKETDEIIAGLVGAADNIKETEIQANIDMGRYGAQMLEELSGKKGKLNILTHCNAGALATGGWGTALGVIRAAFEKGIVGMVYADETRPRLQGARLTCFELKEAGIPYTLITDNMSGMLMKEGEIDAAIVGADRIAANGDVANKIGTYMVAVLAKENSLPFYVAAPRSTFDFNTPSGDDIEIEDRDVEEVIYMGKERICPEGTKAVNPAFDVTEHRLITAYITEKGVISKPDELQ
ncbi:MAG: S-methyl-5-thioribose-1-phosphate isomerase [Elusimicrobiota bacterium]